MMSTPRVIYGRRIFPLGLAARGSADPSPKARFWEQHPAIEMLPAFAVVALSEDNECNRDLSPLETDCLSGGGADSFRLADHPGVIAAWLQRPEEGFWAHSPLHGAKPEIQVFSAYFKSWTR